jgi:hypothetical protein
LIQYLCSFSFCQKWLAPRVFATFANKKNFIVSKLTLRKSKSSDSNPPNFAPKQITMTLIFKISVIVNRKVSS